MFYPSSSDHLCLIQAAVSLHDLSRGDQRRESVRHEEIREQRTSGIYAEPSDRSSDYESLPDLNVSEDVNETNTTDDPRYRYDYIDSFNARRKLPQPPETVLTGGSNAKLARARSCDLQTDFIQGACWNGEDRQFRTRPKSYSGCRKNRLSSPESCGGDRPYSLYDKIPTEGVEEAHDKNTVSLGDVSQPLSDFPDDLRAAEVDPVFPDGTNNPDSLCGAKETDGATTSQNEVLEADGAGPVQKEALEAESLAIADNETLTPLKTKKTDDRDGEYLTVLELDEEPNIYIELKEDENDAVTFTETEEIDDKDGEYLTVLELDEEPNIYIELKEDENDAVTPQETVEIDDGDGEY